VSGVPVARGAGQGGAPASVNHHAALGTELVQQLGYAAKPYGHECSEAEGADSKGAGPIDVSLETSASSPTTACAIRLRRRQPEAFVL
jgi:hypothetical protein